MSYKVKENLGTIEIDMSSLVSYGDESEEAYDFEAVVNVHCTGCNYSGFVDVDHNGYEYSGECLSCGLQFVFHG